MNTHDHALAAVMEPNARKMCVVAKYERSFEIGLILLLIPWFRFTHVVFEKFPVLASTTLLSRSCCERSGCRGDQLVETLEVV